MMLLKQSNKELITDFLRKNAWISNTDSVQEISIPGEGNMNYVIRVKTEYNRLILKQSSPYVEKYPQIEAPQHRILVETHFYQIITSNPDLQNKMPKMIGSDEENSILALEDLGESADFMHLYKKGELLTENQALSLIEYLNLLHQVPSKEQKSSSILENTKMRQLNAEHIFNYPFQENNGFNLDQIQKGLEQEALIFRKDKDLSNQIKKLEKYYLSNGKTLLHGDYYPGSWLSVENDIKIIDPEFGFYGDKEFDLGILFAHLLMTEQPRSLIELIKQNYIHHPLNQDLVEAYTGVEILRRMIGLAQLPLELSLKEKSNLMRLAKYKIITAKI